jgi:hypothetical protein
MDPTPFEHAEALLRHAVTYRRLREVDSRIHAYCAEANRELKTLPKHDSRRRDLLTRVLEVLEWTRLMLLAARESCAARLERAAVIDRYLGTQIPAPRPETHLDL